MNIQYGKILDIFNSKLKVDEILYLLENQKIAVRQLFFENELAKVLKFCKENNLYSVESKFKIVFVDQNEKFSNKGEKIKRNDKREGAIVLYISKIEKQAYLAALAEAENNNELLGEILGYPDCCIDYFNQNFSFENSNPELNEKNIEKYNCDSWLIRSSKRNEDMALISHFPCSWDCNKSLEIAEERLLIMEKYNQIRAKELYEGLRFLL